MKKLKTLLALSIVVAGFAFGSCKKTEKLGCHEAFEKYYEVNVKAFMSTMPAADTLVSRKIAEAILNKAYELDSTFFLLDAGKARDEFAKRNQPVFDQIRDSILTVYSQEQTPELCDTIR